MKQAVSISLMKVKSLCFGIFAEGLVLLCWLLIRVMHGDMYSFVVFAVLIFLDVVVFGFGCSEVCVVGDLQCRW